MANPVDTRLVIGPNASLDQRGAWIFMGLVGSIALGIAIGFALRGFWPVLPFAGMELIALGAALWVTQRRNRYREVLRFEGDALHVEFGAAGRGALHAVELPRAWAGVRIAAGLRRNAPTRLLLHYAGHSVEIGRCLTDEEREHLAGRIRELLQPAWRSTPDTAEQAKY